MKAVFDEVALMPGEEEDGLRIDADSVRAVPIRDDDQYGGVRVTMTTLIGTVRIPVQIDVGIGDAITPAAKTGDVPVLLDFEGEPPSRRPVDRLRKKMLYFLPSPQWGLHEMNTIILTTGGWWRGGFRSARSQLSSTR
ncbi:MAG: nucleotidyl transferase AbiEii/AbiGii toxin family protein [Kiritimatiellia bacterium]